jgi:sugar/nucleoside kinase (ribokinase family)
MACKTLARLCHGAPLNDDFMQVTPPVVNSVIPLCKIGNDDTGNKLLSLLEDCGSASRNVDTKYIRNARNNDPSARTALAVLPIYKDGRRGCFFDAASNDTFSPYEMLELINSLASGTHGPDLDKSELSFEDMEHYQDQLEAITPAFGAFLFGYPHLLPKMQGQGLVGIFEEARYHMLDGGIIAMDLNGVPEATLFQSSGDGFRTVSDLKNDPVIGPALEHVDILHMNEDELMLLTGCEIEGTDESQTEDEYVISRAVNLFLLCGVAVVAVTRGKRGSFVTCNDE